MRIKYLKKITDDVTICDIKKSKKIEGDICFGEKKDGSYICACFYRA